MKSLRIIIVNFRTPGLVIDCLRSLGTEIPAGSPWRVVVVENASGDGSADKIGQAIQTEGWGAWAQLVAVEKNLGFAGGNNAGLPPALPGPLPDYVLLLNPDTVVRPGAVQALVDFMEQHPTAGIAGSRLEYPDCEPQRSAFRFPTVWSEFESGIRLGFISRLLHRRVVAPPVEDRPHPTEWMAGASMIVRREVFDAIGLMDADYFLYFEETDFCLRAHRAGWPGWYVPASHVVHLVGQSTGVTDAKKPARRVPRYWFESRRRYFQKNHGWLYLRLADVAWTVGFAVWRLRRRLQFKPDHDPPRLLWDFIRYNFFTFHPSLR
jgi:N-acetylglucosaminyl-diphospho-decaprenol L-rhamnosyltransferase